MNLHLWRRLGDPADPLITESVDQLVAEMTSSAWALEKFLLTKDNHTVTDPTYYGSRFYTEEDHGTAHLSLVDSWGNAVAVTSTINQEFGAEIRSPTTGIIFNDQMDDFSYPGITNGFNLPPPPSNFVVPGKRPLSSMAPSVFVDGAGEVRLVVGASGGTKITTATALVAVLTELQGWQLEQSVDTPRLHHQLSPMEVRWCTELVTAD